MNMAKFCANCGAPRKEDAKFCNKCGQPSPQSNNTTHNTTTPLEAEKEMTPLETGIPVPVGTDPVVVPELEMVPLTVQEDSTEVVILSGSTVITETPNESEETQTKPQGGIINLMTGTKKKFMTKPFIYGAALLGIILIAGVAWSIFQSGSSSSSTPLVYIKDYELMLKGSKQDKPSIATKNWLDTELDDEAVDMSSDGDGGYTEDTSFYNLRYTTEHMVKFNKTGTRMFYLNKINDDGSANLYYLNPSKVAKAGEESMDQGVRIASNLDANQYNSFQIPASGDFVLYLKNYEDSSGGSLYLYDMKEEILIDKNVALNFSLSGDESSIIYMKTLDDETYDLYTKGVSTKSEKVKIDSDINSIISYSSNLDKVYYTKSTDDDSENPNHFTLYLREAGKDKQKLISDFSDVVSSTSTGQFFFSRATVEHSALSEFVEDNMAAGDLKITEPSYSDYEHEVTNTDYWGYTYTTTDVDYDAYNAAYDLYMAKMERDSLRSDLKNEEIITTTKQLFLYADGKETETTSELARVIYADATSKSIIYAKAAKNEVNKLKLSDITDTYAVKSQFENNPTETKESYIVLNGAPEKEMAEVTVDAYSFLFSEDGKKLYYMESEGEGDTISDTLASWDVIEGKLNNHQIIDENVDHYTSVNDVIWYYKDVKDGQGELLRYADGQKSKVAYDVQLGNTTFYTDDNVVMYMTDYNEKRLMGSLYMLNGEKGAKGVKISDDVNFYNYNTGTSVFYVTDYRLKNGEGDLWEYLGKKDKKQIDSGVQTMLPIQPGFTF
ncbi:zinc ribbon domain-containing protein [Paenibacillus wynnii]|uniref:zinc ribbon domain-containing protein n=1 Tax=Paenibacillus wynnii TaxID=268407 RepID=UPI0027928F49|nr:zinc ribbon domain-containing protein [Paenibacillus wynnii]MDQ0194137.1 dTDP-4-dehydrorhamnose 3,5-epimerase-like enzyme [Paenibacillus wynnii]